MDITSSRDSTQVYALHDFRVSETSIFDFHSRSSPDPDAIDRQLALMDELGIARAVLVGGSVIDPDRIARQAVFGGEYDGDANNDAVLKACNGSSGRLVPFYFANPHREAEHYARWAAEFHGLELSPAVHGVRYDDERILALIRIAQQHRHPVYTVVLGREGVSVHEFVELAKSFPDVNFVMGHGGFLPVDVYAISTIARHPNIVVETSGCYSVVVKVALAKLGADRVLFGTEHPHLHPAVEMAKYRALDLPPAVWQKVAWENAIRLLGE
jgi:predicted TIM-barrel fold metal-dependent hydrolase